MHVSITCSDRQNGEAEDLKGNRYTCKKDSTSILTHDTLGKMSPKCNTFTLEVHGPNNKERFEDTDTVLEGFF